jgi:hypothetical protein
MCVSFHSLWVNSTDFGIFFLAHHPRPSQANSSISYIFDSSLTKFNSYLSANDAINAKLTYINSAGNAVIKVRLHGSSHFILPSAQRPVHMYVDNTTTLGPGALRNSVRMTSQMTIDVNSLLIFDAVHAPFGRSVWPNLHQSTFDIYL